MSIESSQSVSPMPQRSDGILSPSEGGLEHWVPSIETLSETTTSEPTSIALSLISGLRKGVLPDVDMVRRLPINHAVQFLGALKNYPELETTFLIEANKRLDAEQAQTIDEA